MDENPWVQIERKTLREKIYNALISRTDVLSLCSLLIKDIILSAVSTIMMIRDDFVDDRGVVLIQMVVGGQQGEQGRVVGECVLESGSGG